MFMKKSSDQHDAAVEAMRTVAAANKNKVSHPQVLCVIIVLVQSVIPRTTAVFPVHNFIKYYT